MKKKVVSLILASTLFVSMTLTASATELTDANGQADTKSEGSVEYVNTTVYKVTLPTDDCFDFTVDPQGILSQTEPGTYGETLYPDGTEGLIVPKEADGAYINNKSSVPIKLTVDAYVTSDVRTADEYEGTESTVNLVDLDQWNYVNSGIDNTLLLTLDITNDDMDLTTFTDGSKIVTGDALNQNVIAITQNGKPDDKGTQITFALNKAEYEFKKATDITYELKDNEVGDSVGMRLSGLVNTQADWSGFVGDSDPEKIIVKTVFSFTQLTTDYDAAELDDRAHGVLDDRDPDYFDGLEYDEDEVTVVGPAAGEMDYTVGQGALEIPFDFGSGVNEVTIDSIAVGEETVASTDYKVINSVITFKSAEPNLKGIFATAPDGTEEEPVTADITIITSDEAETAVTVYVYPAE